MDYIFSETASIKDLEAILYLQKTNFKDNVPDNVKQNEGYVSIRHDLKLLQDMHKVHPHTIIKTQDGELVAYALVMDRSFSNSIELLKPMFHRIDELHQNKTGDYFVMGQICISVQHRKKGLFKNLYAALFRNVSVKYAHCYTEINLKNTRSLQAHLASGFKPSEQYKYQEEKWVIVHHHLS